MMPTESQPPGSLPRVVMPPISEVWKQRFAAKARKGQGTPCPVCGSLTSFVIDSRIKKLAGCVRRRRLCECGNRYTTLESVVEPKCANPPSAQECQGALDVVRELINKHLGEA